MTRFITPIILIGISIAVFLIFTSPIFNSIADLRAQVASYDEALNNSKMLENERDKLTAKYNSINPDNLIKLQKLLPENIDNIRLILEMEQIASPYGMTLRDVKYDSPTKKIGAVDATTPSGAGEIQGGVIDSSPQKDYGVWNLEFSTTGTYNNFLNFTRDLQSNLRIVDISSVQFLSSDTRVAPPAGKLSPDETYKYNFKIQTYWLKN